MSAGRLGVIVSLTFRIVPNDTVRRTVTDTSVAEFLDTLRKAQEGALLSGAEAQAGATGTCRCGRPHTLAPTRKRWREGGGRASLPESQLPLFPCPCIRSQGSGRTPVPLARAFDVLKLMCFFSLTPPSFLAQHTEPRDTLHPRLLPSSVERVNC